jgi:phosphoenolpyruvate-protein kinase (PTS system EI component)
MLGLGIRELILSPRRGAAVRQAVRGINSQRAKEIADRALGCRTPSEVRELLAQLHSCEAIRAPC